MPINLSDRTLLRDLAQRVADIAQQPEMTERRQRWMAHNALQSSEPMMLVFPEGAWEELILPDDLHCEGSEARAGSNGSCGGGCTPLSTSRMIRSSRRNGS